MTGRSLPANNEVAKQPASRQLPRTPPSEPYWPSVHLPRRLPGEIVVKMIRRFRLCTRKRNSVSATKYFVAWGSDENSRRRHDISVTAFENIRPYENSVETTENNRPCWNLLQKSFRSYSRVFRLVTVLSTGGGKFGRANWVAFTVYYQKKNFTWSISYFSACFTCSFGLRCHGSLQLYGQPYVLAANITRMDRHFSRGLRVYWVDEKIQFASPSSIRQQKCINSFSNVFGHARKNFPCTKRDNTLSTCAKRAGSQIATMNSTDDRWVFIFVGCENRTELFERPDNHTYARWSVYSHLDPFYFNSPSIGGFVQGDLRRKRHTRVY